ncbi:1-phosphofructokinase family hexose kinase [Micromonospora sp. DT46]|uniref:1-phosphofructokinase family hexose kinase n=1 Tax=unclassified Micromonospora TaxID=2617518 RepID=UPI001788DE68|nr:MULTISPECIES: PfkB family carbohydrate kinase [unclassified Micromonospora]WSG01988.1 PfkB family carbohydrate kinase [Micromonospora sp. NBC_01740]
MSGHVMVFAPTPRLTVTVDQPSEAPELHLHPGGQGVWQARMVMSLGVDVVLCAALGGEIGQVLEPLLVSEGVHLKVVVRDSGSGGYVHDRREGSRQEIVDVPGQPLSRHELDELYNLALGEGLRASVSVLSGPNEPSLVPADLYRRFAADLGANGSRVVVDLCGEHLDAVLDSGVFFLKVSHEELIADGRADGEDEEQLTRALYDLHAGGAENVVVSRADKPALALVDGEVFEVEMPRLEAADPRGAGDSMTAGVAAVVARGGDVRTAIRTGAAAGALNVTRHGLGTGRLDSITGLVDRVRLVPAGSRPQERTSPDELAERAAER